jgi:hypothetical protein
MSQITHGSRTSGTEAVLFGITFSHNQFVAAGENGTILTSP